MLQETDPPTPQPTTRPETPVAARASTAPPEFVLRWADNALIHSQRLGEWTGHGPVLEEDIALANIALDHLGQARMLLSHAGRLMDPPQTEDDLAYFRDAAAFRNFTALELPNSGVHAARGAQGDYAFTIVRHALYSAYMLAVWERLLAGPDANLAEIAGKAIKETRYHWRHASDWLVKLGDGTEHSHQRMQMALEQFLPYTNEWFDLDALDLAFLSRHVTSDCRAHSARSAGDAAPDHAHFSRPDQSHIAPAADSRQPLEALAGGLRAQWLALLEQVLAESTLTWPSPSALLTCGRYGRHGEHLSVLLAELQSVARAHPGAQW